MSTCLCMGCPHRANGRCRCMECHASHTPWLSLAPSGEPRLGWRCPGCQRCYSPHEPMCLYCGTREHTQETDKTPGSLPAPTCSNVRPIRGGEGQAAEPQSGPRPYGRPRGAIPSYCPQHRRYAGGCAACREIQRAYRAALAQKKALAQGQSPAAPDIGGM